jgi:hypothetical protein
MLVAYQLEFCRMKIRPIFFQEISFLDFLEELTQVLLWQVAAVWEGKIEKRDFSFPKWA